MSARFWPFIIALLGTTLSLTACARVGSFAANIPYYFSDAPVTTDIAYDSDHDLKLDVYSPPDAAGKGFPVIVFFYGGSYSSGSKNMYHFIADAFTREGYIVVIPDYRQYPAVKFPAFFEDGANAVAWVQNNIGKYKGDPSKIFILGHSAGAHIGALLVADKHYLKDAGVDYANIRGFAGLAGPYDFVPDEPVYKDIFGPPENYPNMQVTTFIDGSEPPMLLLHGLKDTTVNISNMQKLKTKIYEKHGIVTSITYKGLDHIGIVGAMTWIQQSKAPVRQHLLTFFNKLQGIAPAPQ